VIGVSGDSPETNASFREACSLPYALVGDPDGRIRAAYRVKWPLIGLCQRVTYVIGRDRRVRVAFWNEFDVEAHIARALVVVAEATRAAKQG
jgi:peroxiredoxin Q/BCP